ncbi:MAG: DUF2975 domain-containing protein [Hyphomonadaceae bacterium]|nr:DUF2975 domain-containing protein [Hyphomonadaceae bacterium]
MKPFKALGRGSVASLIQVGLHLAWIALWLAAGGLALIFLAWIGVHLAIANGLLSPDFVTAGDRKLEYFWTFGSARIVFDNPNDFAWPYAIPAILAAAVVIAGLLVVVARLKKLFGNFASGQPFSADNAGHLRVIWIALLVMEVSRYAIAALMKLLVLAIGQPEDVNVIVAPPFSFSAWAAILILIVLAEVFREGARLREDQELTI